MDFSLADCNHAHIAWRFDEALPNGLDSRYDHERDLLRLTPITSIAGQDLCSTPLSSFDTTQLSATLDQCVSSYNAVNSNYTQCTATLEDDAASIGDLKDEISDLQNDVDAAYNNGYSDGYGDGGSDGYSSGYDAGYLRRRQGFVQVDRRQWRVEAHRGRAARAGVAE